jgi:hypothetical protein
MLPDVTLPPSLTALLAVFQPCFTAPTYRTFCGLMAGFVAQTGRRTVCGMLTGAGLSRIWTHDRAHYFFARAVWSPEQLGVALARMVVRLLVADGAPVLVAIDDTLFKRRGKKVWAASWFHDGSATGPKQVGYGNNWVVAGLVVTLPFLTRPVCLPVLAKLVVKSTTTSSSRLYLAAVMIRTLAEALPGRSIHGVGDAAYSGKDLGGLGDRITWTTRLRADAALYDLPPQRTGKRGRPKVKGDRLPGLKILAARACFTQVSVTRYGKTTTVQAAVITCLWYSVFGSRPVQVVLIRDTKASGYDLALVTTDLTATAAEIIERYASRWSIEVAFEDAKSIFGVGQARNRKADAVRRTVPFTLTCQTLTMLWYATAGHHPADLAERRTREPWYTSKTQPATTDMIAKLRRVLIAAKYRPSRSDQPTPAEIHAIRLAWEHTAA